ncbi:hypothetical protein NHQ30_010903 [Ciborinia camelliae]|nr:hypothetical protein NHQ30_010903 [Ciborinia camelliae]
MGSITPFSDTTSSSSSGSISTCSCISIHPPYPLHSTILPKLDPTYKSFYNTHLINTQVVHHQPLHISRSSSILLPGASDPLPVGSIFDLKISLCDTSDLEVKSEGEVDKASEGEGTIDVRVFIPKGEQPEGGWPLCMYFHGGGWVLGGIETENAVCTNLCQRGDVVVVSVDYRRIQGLSHKFRSHQVCAYPERSGAQSYLHLLALKSNKSPSLAPENPYPTAPNDCQAALLSILHHPTYHSLPINPSLIALSGSSAGGNIAAVLSHRLSTLPTPIPISLQLLIVPVMDNSASAKAYPSWAENEFSPALPAEKMMWFRYHYLPNEENWEDVDASPLLNTISWGKQPRTLVVVGELDVLRDEGVAYAEKVSRAGVQCRLEVMAGMPHPFCKLGEWTETELLTVY